MTPWNPAPGNLAKISLLADRLQHAREHGGLAPFADREALERLLEDTQGAIVWAGWDIILTLYRASYELELTTLEPKHPTRVN